MAFHRTVNGSQAGVSKSSARRRVSAKFSQIRILLPPAILTILTLEVANARGACRLRAVITENVAPGVVASPKWRWPPLSKGKRGAAWTTSAALVDLAAQRAFHSNLVEDCLDAVADPGVLVAR
jgi:hypothetical protein